MTLYTECLKDDVVERNVFHQVLIILKPERFTLEMDKNDTMFRRDGLT